jgi:predicted RNase H-like nuclease (RuvC/YqgF family)
VDVDVEVGFLLPQCHEMGGFLDNYPLKVLASEKKIITGMTVEHRGESLARNAAGLILILETALTLNEAAGKPSKEVHELKEEKALLETKVLGHENRVEDLIGKQENFARVKAELREQETELEQLRKEVGDLRIKAGEMDKLEEEVSRLKAAMAPAVDEPDTTCDMSSRAELAGEIRLL